MRDPNDWLDAGSARMVAVIAFAAAGIAAALAAGAIALLTGAAT